MSSLFARICPAGLLAGFLLFSPLAVHAQEGPQQDAGRPDDPNSPEGDDNTGRVPTNCRTSNDCATRFSCTSGKCKYTGVREAETQGCMLGPSAALMVLGVAAVAGSRRRR
ncbi:MXAN_6627.5 family MYXO-CTERM protein [Corallococcus sp. EGB]|uniref:MXAN_6627.5 family MYXO-CTERM protein n=1 Tax=Corallococcus sp. EGB TaxID=1521117 RepID=UPI001CBB3C85|nr:MXAN_6627.5 family MYXO-CTERM protein [Corallococcus sp. EGB]